MTVRATARDVRENALIARVTVRIVRENALIVRVTVRVVHQTGTANADRAAMQEQDVRENAVLVTETEIGTGTEIAVREPAEGLKIGAAEEGMTHQQFRRLL